MIKASAGWSYNCNRCVIGIIFSSPHPRHNLPHNQQHGGKTCVSKHQQASGVLVHQLTPRVWKQLFADNPIRSDLYDLDRRG